ncbi:hypothetical protein Pflav_014860 [Phytohabitans flavus]|uniref:AMP-dependent synthetase/ligase domain-containing protein n=1 Tax=Phytohabitans flavus TaxID=1076124 RepID=A0A6F8XMN7_9ACTN|nr:hypothetical protein Pflav_014860 [Phytohabitans flavus]
MSEQLRLRSEDTRTAPATNQIAGPAAALVLTADGVDNGIRWRPGERLHHLFERRCDEFKTEGDPDHLAVDDGELRMTYAQLDALANQLARHLLAQGVSPGDRVGLFVDKSAFAYLVMLAASKIHAAYVPLDAAFPADRISFIVADAGVRTILTISALAGRLDGVDATVIQVDTVVRVDERVDIDLPDARRIGPDELAPADDDLAYIIYTSGTTGQPKGVAINQVNICNFVQVAAETYGLRADDRVYQGMTIAFDFSVEEIWVPLICGATLVPSTSAGPLVGRDLAAFLAQHRVTALCCVPTLLATIEEDVPELRFILVSGEACPPHLVSRWHRPGRTLLNVYGPTETSVTATYARLAPDEPLTIGVPLPTYSVVILDENQRALPRGETGEIGIAGICLSPGYVNRDDLTARTFVPDNVGILNNPSRRIYRTGDLGRVNHDGNIEYLGRIDSQVKIRGYRIELAEIESVLLRLPRVAQAAVTSYEPDPGRVELAAFYTQHAGAPRWTTDTRSLSCGPGYPATWCRRTSRSCRICPDCPATRWTARGCPHRPGHGYSRRGRPSSPLRGNGSGARGPALRAAAGETGVGRGRLLRRSRGRFSDHGALLHARAGTVQQRRVHQGRVPQPFRPRPRRGGHRRARRGRAGGTSRTTAAAPAGA